jgi:3-oxoacyl-[acyl-carrier protein] reductase
MMRSIVVTGGTRGLGFAIARALVAEGFRVIAIARRTNEQFTAAVCEAGRDALHFRAFDLSDIPGIPALVKQIRSAYGPIYGLVNNAALGTSGTLALMHTSEIERLVRLNVTSPLVLTKYVVRSMMSEGSGRIVNIASIAGFTGFSGLSAYGATKASVIGFTRSLAREVGPLGITVNAIAPGFIATDMTDGMDRTHLEQVVRRSALRRLAEADDVANAVAFLFDKRAKNVTGTVVTIDAGSTA